ncbi:MAG: alpha/beta hydrolase [Vicinamibacteria bacterium]
MRRAPAVVAALAWLVPLALNAPPAFAGEAETVPFALRGKELRLHLYGSPAGAPVVLASGDGGFVHLAPEVAHFLAGRGLFVVGLDSKAYLSAFTSGSSTLATRDVPADFQALVERARGGRSGRALLVGVSEGAGLAVLAASDPRVAAGLDGVVGLGLPEQNELGWRFKDSLIYLTKGTPNEPLFRASDFIPKLTLPLAAIHATQDEFVPLEEARRLMGLPGGPKRLWVVPAGNHRFSDAQPDFRARLLEAIAWIGEQHKP